MTPEQLLTGLGWPVDRIGLTRAVRLFQGAYNLGPALLVDGVAGPKTTAALYESLNEGRRLSPSFTVGELACHCAGRFPGCEALWPTRELLHALETLRAALYPRGLQLVSACRCVEQNKLVGGKPSSLHLLGMAADVPPAVTVPQVQALKAFNGIGYSPRTGKVCHVDVRHVAVRPFEDGA